MDSIQHIMSQQAGHQGLENGRIAHKWQSCNIVCIYTFVFLFRFKHISLLLFYI